MIESATPSEPIPFRILVDEAMKLTRREFRRMYLPVAVPIALMSGILVWVQSTFMTGFMSASDPASIFTSRGCLVFLTRSWRFSSCAGCPPPS